MPWRIRGQGDLGVVGEGKGGSALLSSCWAVCARFLCVTSLDPLLPHLGPTRTCDQPDFTDVKSEIQRGQVTCQGCVGSGAAGITKPLRLKTFSLCLSVSLFPFFTLFLFLPLLLSLRLFLLMCENFMLFPSCHGSRSRSSTFVSLLLGVKSFCFGGWGRDLSCIS